MVLTKKAMLNGICNTVNNIWELEEAFSEGFVHSK